MAYTSINKSSSAFSTKLFTGNGSTNNITGIGHASDLVWLKSRSGANDHQIYDTMRGATKYFRAESSDMEGTAATGLTAFTSDGFTLGSAGTTNNSGGSMVSWSWKVGGTGSANTAGSINSTVSANSAAGISMVSYVGTGDNGSRTVGHGLSSAPEAIWIKNRSANENWVIGSNYTHPTLPWKYKMGSLDNNTVRTESGAYFADTAPTNALFTIEGNAGVNGSGNNMQAYCFHSVPGFSSIGRYRGTGNAHGPFIYTGHSVGWLLIKKITGSVDSWFINDNQRSVTGGSNTNHYYLRPDVSTAEGTSTSLSIDLLSNGFKIRNADTAYNHDNSTYFYMSFASAPIVGSNNVPANAK